MNTKRIPSSIIGIGVTVLAVINDWIFLVAILLLTVGGLYEFFYLIKKKGIPIYSYMGIVIGVVIPLSIFLRFEPTKGWELLFIVLALVAIFVMQLGRNNNRNAIVGIATTLFGVLYVSWFLSFTVKIRFMLPGWEGIRLLGFLLVVTKASDIGALLLGSRYGKHPLMPVVSPNKTIEGSIGGCLFSLLAAVALQYWLPPQLDFSWWRVALLGIFIGGLGQLGDLSESLIKRDCNVKDSGKMLPAMGGVLDAIDSILFTAPAFYFYTSNLINF
jgi:phosphatidate cytidylyltransferase